MRGAARPVEEAGLSGKRGAGADGRDGIVGGDGYDILNGGKGHDTFRFDDAPLSALSNVDKVKKFSHGKRTRSSLLDSSPSSHVVPVYKRAGDAVAARSTMFLTL